MSMVISIGRAPTPVKIKHHPEPPNSGIAMATDAGGEFSGADQGGVGDHPQPAFAGPFTNRQICRRGGKSARRLIVPAREP